MKTHAEIISLWPSVAELARDLGQDYETVRLWRSRNRIPTWHWKEVVDAATARGFSLSLQDLAVGMAKVATA